MCLEPRRFGSSQTQGNYCTFIFNNAHWVLLPRGQEQPCKSPKCEAHSPLLGPRIRERSPALSATCAPCLPPTDLLLFLVGPHGGISDSKLLMTHLPLLIKKKQLRKKQFSWAGFAEIRLTGQVSANMGVGGDIPLSKPQIQV